MDDEHQDGDARWVADAVIFILGLLILGFVVMLTQLGH